MSRGVNEAGAAGQDPVGSSPARPGAPGFLRVEDLLVRVQGFRGFRLDGVSLELGRGEVLVVLGPSGAGKSLLLETIAGFYRPEMGRIWLGGREITALPPERRGIGFMFQDYALFPHMTVAENVSFSLRFGRAPAAGRRGDGAHVGQVMEMLGIAPLAKRYPATLSGGERQRVALARALVRRPELFLFDEPMSALDARARESLREELHGLLRRLGVTTVYVTHDQSEALAMGDRIAVLHEGHVLQAGPAEEVFARPATPFVAGFVGMDNLLPGRVTAVEASGEPAEVEVEGLGAMRVSCDGTAAVPHGVRGPGAAPAAGSGPGALAPGREVLVGFRPEDVGVSACCSNRVAPRFHNAFETRVTSINASGIFYKLTLECLGNQAPHEGHGNDAGGRTVVAYLTRRGLKQEALAPGSIALITIPPEAVCLVPRPGG